MFIFDINLYTHQLDGHQYRIIVLAENESSAKTLALQQIPEPLFNRELVEVEIFNTYPVDQEKVLYVDENPQEY